jgi:hypothetical protein
LRFLISNCRFRYSLRANWRLQIAIDNDSAIARFAGSIYFGRLDPGAYAPGFTLTPAPQAEHLIDSIRGRCPRLLNSHACGVKTNQSSRRDKPAPEKLEAGFERL